MIFIPLKFSDKKAFTLLTLARTSRYAFLENFLNIIEATNNTGTTLNTNNVNLTLNINIITIVAIIVKILYNVSN